MCTDPPPRPAARDDLTHTPSETPGGAGLKIHLSYRLEQMRLIHLHVFLYTLQTGKQVLPLGRVGNSWYLHDMSPYWRPAAGTFVHLQIAHELGGFLRKS